MGTNAEHAQGPALVKVVELVGISKRGWEDAARQLIALTSSKTRHVTGIDLIHQTAVVRDGEITEYHVTAKVAFIVEPAAIDQ
jgi:flavin-binding protein dodecin